MNMDEITELQDSSVFGLKPTIHITSWNEKDLIQGITIQMSLDQTLIERTGYTVVDILSDVGGLQGILISVLSLLLSILNHSQLESYLASKLFKSDHIFLTPLARMENLKLYCIKKILPHRLACYHQQQKQAALDKARAALDKEMNVIKLIRSSRYFHLALKHLLDPQVRKELKKESQFREIDVKKTEQAVSGN